MALNKRERNALDKAIKMLTEARSQDLAKTPVRLHPKYKHFIGRTSQLEKDLRDAEKINRNAPLKVYKIEDLENKGKEE